MALVREILLVNPEQGEFVYEKLFEQLKLRFPDTRNKKIQEDAIILSLKTNESLLPFIEDSQSSVIELQKGYVEKLSSIRSIVLKPVSLDEAKFPAFYKAPKSRAGGTYGCVIKFDNVPKNEYFGFGSIAVKIEIPEKRESWLSEASSLQRASELRTRFRTNPFNLIHFKTYEISLNDKTNMARAKVFAGREFGPCDNLFRRIAQAEKTHGKIIASVIEMEFMTQTLNKVRSFTPKQLRSIAFQLVYSSLVNFKTFGLIHHDIKEENILVDRKFQGQTFRFHLDSGNFLLEFSRDEPLSVHFADFGSALNEDYKFGDKSDRELVFQHTLGTGKYISPEVYFYYNLKEPIKKQNIPDRGLESDLWAIGITLLYLVTRTRVDSMLFNVVNDTDFEHFKNTISETVPKGLLRPGAMKDSTLAHPISKQMVEIAFQLPLILAVMGEELPKIPDLGLKFGDLKIIMDSYWQSKNSSKYKRRIGLLQDNIKHSIGEDGYNFIKKCLAPSITDRKRFLFGGILKHPFFDSIRVENFDYKSSPAKIQNFFFPI